MSPRRAAAPLTDEEESTGETVKESLSRSPLFAATGELEGLDHIVVWRLGPIREGDLGRFNVELSEEEIREQFGGGKFQVQGKNGRNLPVKGAHRIIELAGEPIFRSESARRQWARVQGIDPSQQTPATPTTPLKPGRGNGELTATDILLIQQQQADSARREARELADIRARESQIAHERNLELQRAEREADRDRRESRAAQESQAMAAMQTQLMAMMQSMVAIATQKPTGPDPTQAMMAGIQMAMGMAGGGGGGEGGDPVTAFFSRLPETIESLKDSGGGAPGEETFTIKGPVAAKARAAAEALRSQGKDPEAVLGQVLDTVTRGRPSRPAPPANGEARPARPTVRVSPAKSEPPPSE